MTVKCACGGTFVELDGLDLCQCDTCGQYLETRENPILVPVTEKPSSVYSEDKLKAIRGVPVNRIIIGSESKGRLEISIPMFATYDEQKRIIDQQLSLLEYAKAQIVERGLDIMPKR